MIYYLHKDSAISAGFGLSSTQIILHKQNRMGLGLNLNLFKTQKTQI